MQNLLHFSSWPWWAKVLLVVVVIILILLLILLLIEIIVYFRGFMPIDHSIASTAIGTLITGIVTVFAVIAAFIAGYYAKGQLDAAKKTAYGNFLLHLDDMFRHHQRVHTNLHPGGKWSGGKRGPQNVEDWVALENYMGLFERIQVLIEKDIIELTIVNRLYGYRLFNIISHDTIRREKLVNKGYRWINFIKLWKALSDLKSNEGEPKGRAPLRFCWRMRFQVEKGMHWAENLLASSSVCKSLFMAICPDSIASVIRQQNH